jgi:tripeptidyl-peptidase-1
VTVDVVKSWLVDSGIPEERISQSSNKAWLQFDASIGEMEELLQTKYHYYEPVNGGRKHVGCEEYKIPAALSEHIDYVTPGVKLVSTRITGDISMKKRSLDSSPRRAISRESISAGIHSENEQIPGMFR